MTDEERRAWKKEGIAPNAPADKLITYCIARAMYADYDAEIITQKDAQAVKLNALEYLGFIQSLARTNARIIREIALLTAPRKELSNKSREELLEIIARMEALVAGIIKEHDGRLPEFLKIKEEKE